MELLDIMLKRRSVRKYTNEEIPQEKLEKILQAGLLAPTSRNLKPCEFHVIRDKEVLRRLAQAKNAGGAMLADCGAAIAVFADSQKADTWIEDCSIAMSFMHLMAAKQGVGCCWCQIHLRKTAEGSDAESRVREILAVPQHYGIVGILSLGMPEKEAPPHKIEELDPAKIHW